MCIIRNSTTVCMIIMSGQTRLDEWVKFRKNTYKFVYEYEKYGSKKLYRDRLGSYRYQYLEGTIILGRDKWKSY